MGMKFECTAQGIHQQNGCVEQNFTTLFNRVCAMLNIGKFSSFLRNSLRDEATNTVTLLENNLLTHYRDLSPVQHFLVRER